MSQHDFEKTVRENGEKYEKKCQCCSKPISKCDCEKEGILEKIKKAGL